MQKRKKKIIFCGYESNLNIFNYDGNFKTIIKLNHPSDTRKNIHEINGRYLIVYTYQRGRSITTIFDMRKNYKKLLEKIYMHLDIYSFPDKETIVLPPNPTTEFGDEKECGKFIFINLNTFEEKYISTFYYEYDFFKAPKLIHRLKEEKYLYYQDKNWKIIKNNGEEFEVVEELKDGSILGENAYFIDNNTIITLTFGESKIRFLKYKKEKNNLNAYYEKNKNYIIIIFNYVQK